MDYSTFGSIFTVVVFVAFVGVVLWVYGAKSKKSFDDAANLVFDDEKANDSPNENVGVNRQ